MRIKYAELTSRPSFTPMPPVCHWSMDTLVRLRWQSLEPFAFLTLHLLLPYPSVCQQSSFRTLSAHQPLKDLVGENPRSNLLATQASDSSLVEIRFCDPEETKR